MKSPKRTATKSEGARIMRILARYVNNFAGHEPAFLPDNGRWMTRARTSSDVRLCHVEARVDLLVELLRELAAAAKAEVAR